MIGRRRSSGLGALLLVGTLAPAAAAQEIPPPVYPPPAPAEPGYPPPAPGAPPLAPAPPPAYPPPPPGYPQPATGYPYTPYPYPMRPQEDPGYHRHDGFYLRMSLGGGFRKTTSTQGFTERSISGAGPGGTLALGGALVENLILFGELTAATASSPNVTTSPGGTDRLNGVDADFYGVGGGLAYYFMPTNAFISGALLGTSLEFSQNGDTTMAVTDTGIGLDLSTGMEWWVSTNWGLGATAQLLLARMPDAASTLGARPSWTTFSFNIAFSATFN